jgi:hypothetical protein
MNCSFCNKIFSSKSSLNVHQKTTKSCLKLQGKNEDKNFECKYCNKKFTVKQNLTSHYGICKEKEISDKLKEKEEELKKEFNKEKEHLEINYLTTENNILKNKINNQDMTFKLILKNGEIMDIGIRNDGYINATQLCKAGEKAFADYQKTKQTQDYLQALSSNMKIPILNLINSNVGGNHSGTYVHRKVGYHLAQWISPQFAVQVSNVLDNLFMTGKVELGNEKSNSELENIYQEKINNLQNKLKNYETTIFNRNIDYCPIEYYGKDIVYFLKFNIPIHLYDEYLSKYPMLQDSDYKCIEFGVTSDLEKRLLSHKRDKKKDSLIFLHAIELKKRYTASKMEYYIKTIAKQLNISFEYEKKKECVLVNEEMFNILVNKISNGLNNLEDDIEETEIEDEKFDIEEDNVKYKYDIEIKKLDNQKEKDKMDKEIIIKKIEMVTDIFKNNLITFDDFKNMLEVLK